MQWIYNKTVNISGIHVYSSLVEAFEFCWSLFPDEHKTLPKSTRRNVKSNKFAFGIPWLLDLLCKHWYTSYGIWNFCHWVTDVLPCETSPAAWSKEKRLSSQAILGSGIWNWAWGIPNPSSTDNESRIQCLESGIHSMESRIQDCLG